MRGSSAHRVSLTGLGSVTAAGCGRKAIAETLASSALPPSPVDRSAGYHRPGSARTALPVAGFDPRRWISSRDLRRMSRPARFAVSAAAMALEEAGLSLGDLPPRRTGVWMATVFGPCDFSERLLHQILVEGPETASPHLFTESVANAAAARVALACGARGPNVSIAQGEAGLGMAISSACRAIASGTVDFALVGWVDELTPLLHALLDRFRALSRAGGNGCEAPRPFDRRRNGTLATEGSVVALLEAAGRGAARGRPVLATLRPVAAAFDPSAGAVGWGRGVEDLAAALADGLERAGVDRGSVDAIVAGAAGTRDGDALEGRVLKALWGARETPPVVAPKAWLGEAAGAQLAAGLVALEGGAFGAVPGFSEPDPEIGIVPFGGASLDAPRRLLLSALGQGGAAAWTLLEEPAA